jgi:hypothetical protein
VALQKSEIFTALAVQSFQNSSLERYFDLDYLVFILISKHKKDGFLDELV